MSALIQGVVAGPTLKKFTPASITSATALAPEGGLPSNGRPFASTIGNTLTPSRSTVPSWSRPVEAARAPPTSTDDATNASSHSRGLITPPRQDAAECAEGSSEAADRLGAVPQRDAIDLDCPAFGVRAQAIRTGYWTGIRFAVPIIRRSWRSIGSLWSRMSYHIEISYALPRGAPPGAIQLHSSTLRMASLTYIARPLITVS